MDELWDEDAGLLWSVQRDHHMTRDSAWYALGLLQLGRTDRAVRALERVMEDQYDAPGAEFDGTWKRAPEEQDPPAEPVMWIHYDPNWRQFIGTTFAVICDDFADQLPGALVDRMRASIARAVAGEPRDRVSPAYANIALKRAWLDQDEAFAREVADHFFEHGAFLEYNSPTYYGIDLWGLGLWKRSPKLAATGAEMEAALWRDIARFYHAGFRTMCGPFDRAYGMDMTTHATPLGLWIWSLVGRDAAPFPDHTQKFRHPHDFCFAPCVTALGEVVVPDDVLPHLTSFSGERLVEQVITTQPLRVATAWLSDDVMFGGQTGPASGIGFFQHHHATAHWRRPDGTTGWMRLKPEVPADATVTNGELHITTRTTSPITFEFDRPSADELTIGSNAGDPKIDGSTLVYAPADGETRFRITAAGA